MDIRQEESISLFLMLNGVGIVGRIAPAYVADRYTGPMNILLLVSLASIICNYAMIGVTSHPEEAFMPGQWCMALSETLYKACLPP